MTRPIFFPAMDLDQFIFFLCGVLFGLLLATVLVTLARSS